MEWVTDFFMKEKIGTSVTRSDVERVKGIEPSYSAWEADVLPLNYTRTDRTWMILAYPAEKIKREEGKKPADWCMGYKFK